MNKWTWHGGGEQYVAAPVVETIGNHRLARYSGTGGKNEDGALVWSGDGWLLAAILDGHGGVDSVRAVLDTLSAAEGRLMLLCATGAILQLQQELIALLTHERTSRRMSKVRGETACLITYQYGPYLLWLQIGDNTLYLLHPELMRLGQYTLTTRSFFEWIGERNSLNGPVPCFSTGIRELRQGVNHIVLATDGIQEMPGRPYEPPSALAEAYLADPENALMTMLARAYHANTRDSCTMVAWSVDNPEPGLMPSG